MNSNWSYSPEMVKLGVDLCDLDLWPLTLTFCMDVTFVIGNNSWKFHDDTMMGTWWKRCDGQTDGQTDWTSHIAAWSQLKNIGEKFFGISILFGPNLDNWQLVTTLLSTAGSLIMVSNLLTTFPVNHPPQPTILMRASKDLRTWVRCH